MAFAFGIVTCRPTGQLMMIPAGAVNTGFIVGEGHAQAVCVCVHNYDVCDVHVVMVEERFTPWIWCRLRRVRETHSPSIRPRVFPCFERA